MEHLCQYDVEVEARLQALEKGLADCKAACAANSHTHSGGGGDVSERLEALIKEVKKSMKINI